MRVVLRCCLVTCALLTAAGAVVAQAPPPLLVHTFDSETAGWIAMGTNARASITQHLSFNGRGSLKYEYDAVKGAMSGLLAPLPEGILPRARSVRLWVYSDYPTTLAVALQEKTGARYVAPAAVPGGKWQEIHAALTDFMMLEGPDNPLDADRRLTPEDVSHVGIIDVGVMLALSGDAELAKVLSVQPGAHTLLVDDFTILASAPASRPAQAGSTVIDAFDRPHVPWLVLGTVAVTREAASGDRPAAMVLQYDQAPGKVVFVGRPLSAGVLKDARSIRFTVRSDNAAMLLVRVEEAAGGAKFQAVVNVEEGGAPQDVTIAIADLAVADDSPVKGRALDLSKAAMFAIADGSGLLGMTQEVRPNALRVSRLRAVTAPGGAQ